MSTDGLDTGKLDDNQDNYKHGGRTIRLAQFMKTTPNYEHIIKNSKKVKVA